jgi:hypothetical protein
MNRLPAAACAVMLLFGAGCASTKVPSTAAVPDTAPRFYHGKPYGSERQFNPITQILNEGFDQLRVDNGNRRLGDLRFRDGAKNVIRALLHPDSAMRSYGIWRAWRDELLPLSTKANNGGNWVPNYEFHLIGSGMVSQRMTEWYEANDVPHPVAASFVTMFTAHFINEALEDGGRLVRGHAFDPVADLYIFDLGGFLMFRSRRVQSFFSKTVELTNWAGQATFGFPDLTLENAGQEYLLRSRLPRTDRWRGFFAFGMSTLGGVSYGKKGGLALSIGTGAEVVDTPVVDTVSGKKTVTLKPNGGIFIDRAGSLLFSINYRDAPETVVSANLYPGVIRVGPVTFGLWTHALRDGRWRFGIVAPDGIGIGTSGLRGSR